MVLGAQAPRCEIKRGGSPRFFWKLLPVSVGVFATDRHILGDVGVGRLNLLLEKRDGLDVCRVREHVQDTRRLQRIAFAVHEHAGVAC